MFKRVMRVLSALTLALGITLAIAAPASAACTANYVCLYQDEYHGGGKYINNYSIGGDNNTYHDGDVFGNGYHLYDAVSSYENAHATWYVLLWTNHYWQGDSWRIYPGESLNWLFGFNDVASSHYWTSF